MSKKSTTLLAILLLATGSANAAICEGNAENSCNGLLNSCTSDGLCVVDTASGNCCSLSSGLFTGSALSRSSSTGEESETVTEISMSMCNSDIDASVCDGYVIGITSEMDVIVLDSMTSQPTNKPIPSPTKSPTASPATTTPSISSPPTITCFNIEIGIIFDKYPDETRWEITRGRKSSQQNNNALIIKESPKYSKEDGYREASDSHIICLPKGKYTFTIYDRNNDGMCDGDGMCNGMYVVSDKSSGEMIMHGSSFGESESVTFNIPYEPPYPLGRDDNGDGMDDRTGNVIPTIPLDAAGFPSCANEFGLHLKTDDYGVETKWELRKRSINIDSEDNHNGTVVASGGPYTSDFTYDVTYCLEPGKYTFIFYDWQCDGLMGETMNGHYALLVNGMEVFRGGRAVEYEEIVNLEFTNPLDSGINLWGDNFNGGGAGANAREEVQINRGVVGARLWNDFALLGLSLGFMMPVVLM